MGLDRDGYPVEESLVLLEKWDIYEPFGERNENLYRFLSMLRDTWWAAEWGFRVKKWGRLYLSTGGWSGNEETVKRIGKNWTFWSMRWLKSRRGGHYTFEIPRSVARRLLADNGDPGDGR